jgi:methyl-accepting chemotaxis protein
VVHVIREGTTQIEQGADRTQQAQHMLQKILFSADRSSTMVSDIADALHHQKNIGHDLIEVMKHINGLTAEITRATQEEKSGAVQINDASQHILTLASQTQETTVLQLNRVQKLLEIAQAVQALNEQNLASSQRISHTTVEALARQVEMLLGSIGRFKLESK